MDIKPLLRELVQRGGSDLYITRNSPPLVRAQGVNLAVRDACLTAEETRALADLLMNESEKANFAEFMEMNMATLSATSGP